jgi:hypothetical protein
MDAIIVLWTMKPKSSQVKNQEQWTHQKVRDIWKMYLIFAGLLTACLQATCPGGGVSWPVKVSQ